MVEDSSAWYEVIAATCVPVLVAAGLTLPFRGRSLAQRIMIRHGSLNKPYAPFIFLTFSVALALGAVLSARYGKPLPRTHDEFAYLLSADTFASGRLTNPPVPASLTRSFTTFQVLQSPTYSSKYPPGQGLVLALGQLLGGHPVAGIWLGCALAVAAITWALLPLLTPPLVWASAVIALWAVCLGRWGYSYWGGAVAAAGGALFFGGLYRCLKSEYSRTWRYAFIAGLGTGMLALTRPFEGVIYLGLTTVILTVAMLPAAVHLRGFWRKGTLVAAFLVPVALTFLFMAIHNQAVTGNPLLFPHALYSQQSVGLPFFIWQGFPPEPTYTVKDIHDFFMVDTKNQQLLQNSLPYLELLRFKIAACLGIFFRPLSSLVFLLGALFALRQKSACLLLLISAAALPILGVENGHGFDHYLAPFYVAFVGVLAVGCGELSKSRLRRLPSGLFLALVILGIGVSESARLVAKMADDGRHDWSGSREVVLDKLNANEENSLVLVHYLPSHSLDQEWVYNSANINQQKVIWARSIDTEQDAALIAAYPDRRLWSLDVSWHSFALEPMVRNDAAAITDHPL